MATTVARLSSNGVYFTNTYFDEVTYTNNSITQAGIFSAGFDEVSLQGVGGGLARRETNDGQVLITGYFDEVTGLTNTYSSALLANITTNTATIISAASPFGTQYNSYRFNGTTSQYITIANGGDFTVGTGDFTIEWWHFENDANANPRVFSIGTYSTAVLGFSIEPTYYFWMNSGNRLNYNAGIKSAISNVWKHIAIVRNGTSLAMYINGTSVATATNSLNVTDNTTALTIANEGTKTSASAFGGLIYGLRFTKGTAVYTGNFTVPTGPLTQGADANPYGGVNTAAIPANNVKVLLNP